MILSFFSLNAYFYPRSPCGERPHNHRSRKQHHPNISIHALLAESDPSVSVIFTWFPAFLSTLSLRRATGSAARHCGPRKYFYPRSPCGERLFLQNHIFFHHNLFLSTLSLRRATASTHRERQAQHDFYPRSPCGERLRSLLHCNSARDISIHALLAESDA